MTTQEGNTISDAVLEEEFIEDLDIDREPTVYEIGDQVVYPHHGAGKVLKKEMKEVLGEKREYLTIKILHNDMTVMVPCCNADKAGLRRVIGEDDVKKVLSVLRDDVSQMPKNWNRRFKHNREKIKTGDVFELAEVVRNLAIRETEKGLSTGEKQMYTRAKKILASELMYALDMEEDEAETHLEELIAEAHAEPQRGAGHGVGAARDECRRHRSRRRQRRTPWSRPAQGVRRLCRPSADRVEPRGAPLGSAIAWSCAPPGYDDGPDRVRGGDSRSASVRNALAAAPEATVAVVHDAARPLVTRELVERCLVRLEPGIDGAIAAVPMTDTVKEAASDGRVLRTLDRSTLWAIQTPQVFRADILRRALERDAAALAAATDDASLVDDAGGVITVVEAFPRTSRSRASRTCASPRRSLLTDYHVHLRPDEEGTTAERYFTAGQRRALSGSAAERGIEELGVAEHIHRFVQSLEIWEHPWYRYWAPTTSTSTATSCAAAG